MKIKKRFWLCKRGAGFYAWDTESNTRTSLETRNRREAEQLINAKNVAVEQPGLNLALARAYLSGSDPRLAQRTWEDVVEEICRRGQPQSQAHRRRQLGRPIFTALRKRRIVETTAADFLALLNSGLSFVNSNLRCLHNLALGLGWLPGPVLHAKVWPPLRPKPKRGITQAEHDLILASEKNPERHAFYELLWEVGAAQSDGANLHAENIDWENRVLRYRRMKTGEWSCLVIGARLETLLKSLPSTGPLFPTIRQSTNGARSSEFCRRCRVAGVTGVSLHCYRYAWAERAKACGYPERFAQSALGHNSRAVHQAYAKGAIPVCPSMDQFETEMKKRLVPLPANPPAVVMQQTTATATGATQTHIPDSSADGLHAQAVGR
jgi:integrase